MKKSLIALLLLLALSTGLLAACHGKGVVKPTVPSTGPSTGPSTSPGTGDAVPSTGPSVGAATSRPQNEDDSTSAAAIAPSIGPSTGPSTIPSTSSGTDSGTGSGTGEAPLSFDPSRKHTISFWAKNDSNPTQKAIYEKAKKDFEALYPNITVEIRPYSDYGKIYQDVITNIVTKTTPNVCISYPDHIATYLKGQDVVIDLDRYMADPGYGFGGKELLFDGPGPDELIDKFMEEGFFDGHQYDLPFMRSSEALYINKDMVGKLGYEIPEIVSWDWIWEISEKAMEKNGDIFKVNGQKILIPFMYKSTDNMMIQMLRQKEAGYATSRGEVQLFNDTTKELLYTIYQHVNTRAFSTFKIDSYPGNFFNAGRCIFAIDSTAGATWMGSHAPLLDIHASDVVEFETVVLPIPQFNPEKVQMISQGPSLCIFNKEDPQEVLASWLFAQYLLSNEVQIAYAKTEGYVPVTKKAQEAPEYQDYLARAGEDHKEHYDVKIKASQMVMAHMDDTFITPVFAGSTSVRDAAGAMIETVAKGTRRKQVVLNPEGTALDEAYLKGVFDEVSRLYKLDEIELKPADPGQTPETAPATPAETKEGETPATPGSAAPTASPAATESTPAMEKEPLPTTARFLLGSLVAVWVLLGIAALIGYLRKKKKS